MPFVAFEVWKSLRVLTLVLTYTTATLYYIRVFTDAMPKRTGRLRLCDNCLAFCDSYGAKRVLLLNLVGQVANKSEACGHPKVKIQCLGPLYLEPIADEGAIFSPRGIK